MACKCGIPDCPGHRIVNGKALITRHPLLMNKKEAPKGESKPEESTDATLQLLKEAGLPLTRENYLGMAYMGDPPDNDHIDQELEQHLPKEIRRTPQQDEDEEVTS